MKKNLASADCFDEAKNRLEEAEVAVSVARKSAADLQMKVRQNWKRISDIDRLNIKIRANMDRKRLKSKLKNSQQYDELTKIDRRY